MSPLYLDNVFIKLKNKDWIITRTNPNQSKKQINNIFRYMKYLIPRLGSNPPLYSLYKINESIYIHISNT